MVVADKSYDYLAVTPNQKVRAKKKQKAMLHVRMVALTLALFIIGLLYTYQHNRVIYLGYRINATKQKIAALQTDNKKLELKIAGLQSPERIERIAREKLGMKEPERVLLAGVSSGNSLEAASSKDSSGKAQTRQAQKSVFNLVAVQLIERAEALPR